MSKENFNKALSAAMAITTLGSVGVSAVDIKPDITVVFKDEDVDKRYSGGILSNIDSSSITKLGEIKYAEPLVMRPDNGTTITKTSAAVEVKKPVYYNIIKETEVSAKVLEILDKRIEKEASVKRAIQFMAGGEYLTEKDVKPLALKAKITRLNEATKTTEKIEATVVFSEKDLSDAYKKLSPMEKISCTPDILSQSLVNKIPSFYKIRKELRDKSFIYVLNGETYVFTDQNLKPGSKTLIKYDTKGNRSAITNDKVGSFANFSRIAYDEKGLGVCSFDGNKISYVCNTNTNKFDELTRPEFRGTLKQRTVHNLEAAYNAYWEGGGGTNPLGIDLKDIEEYKKTGNTKNKSFEVIVVNPQEKDEKKKLGFVCITGGKCGFQVEENIKNIKLAVEKCNQIDPIITQKWVERGLTFLAINELPGDVFSGNSKNWTNTFQVRPDYGGIIWFNENGRVFYYPEVFSHIEVETNGLYAYTKIGLKGWTRDYVSSYKDEEFIKMTKKYDSLIKKVFEIK